MPCNTPGKISVSLMCANLLHLADDIAALEAAGVDMLHIDIMDNHFVPNITLSPDLTRQIKAATRLPLDVHLMIERPENSLQAYDMLGPEDTLTVHVESTCHIQRALSGIRSMGVRSGLALNPGTPLSCVEYLAQDVDLFLVMTVNPGFAGQALLPSTVQKTAALRAWLNDHNLPVPIAVDGNISFANAPRLRECGANVFVAGTSSVYHPDGSLAANCSRLRRAIL